METNGHPKVLRVQAYHVTGLNIQSQAHLKKAANKMEKTPGSPVGKWKPNSFDPRMNRDAQEFRPTFGRPKIDKKKINSSPHLENVWNLHRF